MRYKLFANKEYINKLKTKYTITQGWIHNYIDLDDVDKDIKDIEQLLGRIVAPDLDNEDSIIIY